MGPRILVLTQVFPPQHGGSGRWLWELYRRLDFDVHVAAARSDDARSFDKTAPFQIARLPLGFANWGVWHPLGAWQYLRAFVFVDRLASRIGPDVVHAGKCLPEGLLASALLRVRGVPYWCYVHGEELTLAETSRELHRLSHHVLRRACKVIANSHHTKSLLVARWRVNESKVVVMHPGVDTTRFKPAPRDPVVRARLGWGNQRVILTVGALQKRKGQDTLIRALPAIRARCPDVLYAIVGEGWERPYLEQLAREHGVEQAVQFRGVPADEELVACYQQCDVFALPNRQVGWDFEGFGMALLEAQACGKPVVTGQSGGTRETLEPSITGEIVPCDTPAPLCEVLVSLLDDPARRARMAAAARDWTVGRFDWVLLSRQAGEVFGSLHGERASTLDT